MMKHAEDYMVFLQKSEEGCTAGEIAEIISLFREEFSTTVKTSLILLLLTQNRRLREASPVLRTKRLLLVAIRGRR